jgi:Rieske Fe-S protein
LAELQKDPITRKDFLGFGILGGIVGAILTIPPAAFVLTPLIDVEARGESNVPDDWFEVGSISDVPEGEPKAFVVDFPAEQVYGDPDVQEGSEGVPDRDFVVPNAIWVSWKTQILEDGSYGESRRPSFLDEDGGGSLTQEQLEEAQESLNVLSNSCAHLGCPVRWQVTEGEGEFRCPCHGGVYNINGDYLSGPPPRGMYSYVYEVREDGNLYVRHEFDVGDGLNEQQPYVI